MAQFGIASMSVLVSLPTPNGYLSWIDLERSAWQEFIYTQQTTETMARRLGYQKPSGVGCGVVVIGGRQHSASTGERRTYYTLDALMAIASLRKVGCKLPVELWHDGDPMLLESNLPDAFLADVFVRDLSALPDEGGSLRAFDLASLVLLHTAFEQVLYLDADVIALSDPTPLFSAEEYLRTGAIFWQVQDPHVATMDVIWEALRCEPIRFKTDNAVMLVHRGKHHQQLELAHYFNQRWRPLRFGYPFFMNGDADMFEFAWLAMAARFHKVTPPADIVGFSAVGMPFCGHSISIRHPNQTDQILFVHRARNKFSFSPSTDMPSNAIKRSSLGVFQGEEERIHGNITYMCFDFYGDMDGRYNVIEVDQSQNSRPQLANLVAVEHTLFALRNELVEYTCSHR